MVYLWCLVALVVVLIGAAAWSDARWRKRGFRTEIRGKGRHKQKVRVRIDPTVPMPEDPNTAQQDWVRMRDWDEPESGKD